MGNSGSVNYYGFVNDNGRRRLARVLCVSEEDREDARSNGLITRHRFCWDEYTDWDEVPQGSILMYFVTGIEIYALPYDLANWMQNLKDNVYLRDLALPGSHDAGTAQSEKVKSPWTRTQAYSIITQLILGIRVFDIRPTRAGNGGGREDGEIWTHHGGCKGEQLSRAVNCVRLFLEAYPTETAIFILSHYKNVSKAAVYADIKRHIGEGRYIGDDNDGCDVNLLTVATARGKLIVFDEDKADRHLGPNGHDGTTNWSRMLRHLRSIKSKPGVFNRYVAALTPQTLLETPIELASYHGLPGLMKWLNEPDSNKIGIVEADWFGSVHYVKSFAAVISEKNRNRGYFSDSFRQTFFSRAISQLFGNR